MFVDTTYFQGTLNVPNLDNLFTKSGFEIVMKEDEINLLNDLFGTFMFSAMPKTWSTESPLSDRWNKLYNGADYTYNGKQYHWKGMKTTIESNKYSIVAYFVYYNWLRRNTTVTTANGEQNNTSEAAKPASSINKQVRVWNTMVDWGNELYQYLQANVNDYPEWQYHKWCNLRKINHFNI